MIFIIYDGNKIAEDGEFLHDKVHQFYQWDIDD